MEYVALLRFGHSAECVNWNTQHSSEAARASVVRLQRLRTWPRAMTYYTFVAVACYGLMAICVSANVIALLGRKDTAYYLHLYTLVSLNVRAVFIKKAEMTKLAQLWS